MSEMKKHVCILEESKLGPVSSLNSVQAMASNAAGAAGGAVGAGVAAGAVAGAAAACGMAAAAVSVVGVTAAVATVAGVSMPATSNKTLVANETMANESVKMLSACGLVDPDMREGRVTFLLEGFEREFDGQTWSIIGSIDICWIAMSFAKRRDRLLDQHMRLP
jgi:hypothetical protein